MALEGLRRSLKIDPLEFSLGLLRTSIAERGSLVSSWAGQRLRTYDESVG